MAKTTIELDLIKPQYDFLTLDKRFKAFVSGFGGSKTWTGCISSCDKYYRYPGHNQGYFAPTYAQIRDIFYPAIDEVSALHGLNVDIKEANKEVHFYSGRRYRGTTICRSMERPQSIVGFTISHALIDELDVLPMDKAQHAWRKIIARMRDKNAHNTIDVTTTPEGFRFVHDQFKVLPQRHPEMQERYGLVQASTRDNAANLPEDYIPSLEEAYPKELIDAYVDGQFVNLTAGTVYRCFDRKVHGSTESIRKGETLYIGMDFNVTKMVASILVQRANGYHAVAELTDVFDTPDMIELLKSRYPDNKKIIYPDPSGKARKSVNASTSDLSLLEQARFSVRSPASNPAVKDRVLAVNKAFEDGKLWINTRECPTLAECLEQQAYGQNGEPDKTGDKDHAPDSLGYFVHYEMPVLKPAHDAKISFVA